MYELAAVTSYCQLCGQRNLRNTMRRPHGCDWWCASCLDAYDEHLRTRSWVARKLGLRPVNIGAAGVVLTIAMVMTGGLGIGVFESVMLVYATCFALVPIGVVQAKATRTRFMRSAQTRLPAATLMIAEPSPRAD